MSPLRIVARSIKRSLDSYATCGDSSVRELRRIAAPTPAQRMKENWETVGRNLHNAIKLFDARYVKKEE